MSLFKKPIFQKASRLTVSLLDQGFYSINNFVVNILLARALAPADYGEYAVVFSLFLFISGFQNALILEPMSVLGPAKYHGNYRRYLRLLLSASLTLTLASAIALLGFSFFVASAPRQLLFRAMASSLPLLLTFWFTRRFCYVLRRPEIALIGTIAYTLVMGAGIYWLYRQQSLNGSNAFYLMTTAGVAAAIITLLRIRMATQHEINTSSISFRALCKEHWKYGRWATGTTLIYWLNSAVIVPFTALFIGYAEAGIFRALQNFVLPVQQFLTALGNYFLPSLAYHSQAADKTVVQQKVNQLWLGIIPVTVLYALLLIGFRKILINLLYPDSSYILFDWLLIFLGCALVFEAFMQVLSIVLRALQRPNAIFWSHAGGVVAFFSIGTILIWQFKLSGVGWAHILLSSINATIAFIYYRKHILIDKELFQSKN